VRGLNVLKDLDDTFSSAVLGGGHATGLVVSGQTSQQRAGRFLVFWMQVDDSYSQVRASGYSTICSVG
jgi:hypothetical protein